MNFLLPRILCVMQEDIKPFLEQHLLSARVAAVEQTVSSRDGLRSDDSCFCTLTCWGFNCAVNQKDAVLQPMKI